MTVLLSAGAEADLRDLIDWLAEQSPDVARNGATRIFSALDRLDTFSLLGRETGRDTRDLVIRFGRDGFVARYRIVADGVVVERVFHGLQER